MGAEGVTPREAASDMFKGITKAKGRTEGKDPRIPMVPGIVGDLPITGATVRDDRTVVDGVPRVFLLASNTVESPVYSTNPLK